MRKLFKKWQVAWRKKHWHTYVVGDFTIYAYNMDGVLVFSDTVDGVRMDEGDWAQRFLARSEYICKNFLLSYGGELGLGSCSMHNIDALSNIDLVLRGSMRRFQAPEQYILRNQFATTEVDYFLSCLKVE